MSAKLSIAVGSVTIDGKEVASVSGFKYEGPAEGLGPALQAHARVERAVSTWKPTRVQLAALALIRDAGNVEDRGDKGVFAGTHRIPRASFRAFVERGVLEAVAWEGDLKTPMRQRYALTAFGLELAREAKP